MSIEVSVLDLENRGMDEDHGFVKYEEFYDEYEPTARCTACHGTGLDDDEFEDCPVCWGEGFILPGGLTGRRHVW